MAKKINDIEIPSKKKKAIKKQTANTKTRKLNNSSIPTTVIAIALSAIIAGGSIYLWQKDINKDNTEKAKEEVKNTSSFFQEKLSEVKNKLEGIESENIELKETNEELKSKTEFLATAKREFNSEELGLTFLYPAIFGEVNLSIDDGLSGKIFMGKFSDNSNLTFGGISADFTDSREPVFTDTQGYRKRQNTYYFKTINEIEITDNEIIPVEIIEYKNGEAVVVDNNSFIIEEEGELPSFSPGENNFGALINLEGEIFSGIAFLSNNAENFLLEDLRAMIQSIEVKN